MPQIGNEQTLSVWYLLLSEAPWADPDLRCEMEVDKARGKSSFI